MRILVIGGTGFIGSFLIPKLKELGHDVTCMEAYHFKTIGELGTKVKIANITDSIRVGRVLKGVNPEVIIHLAAMTSVGMSYDLPIETTMINYLGTQIITECARDSCPNLKHFLYPSSAEVYGVTPSLYKSEYDLVIPNSPYAIAKRATEYYLNYLHKSYDFPVTIFRPFNSYGRIDSNWFVIEKTIYQMLLNTSISGKVGVCELGDKKPIRDFVYMPNHIDAYIKAIEQPDKAIGEIYNICTGEGVSIEQLAEMIRRLTGFKGEIEWGTMPIRPMDIDHLVGDNTKLRTELGWEEPIPLETGLELTVNKWKKKLGVF